MVLRGGFVQDAEWGTAVRITFEEGEGGTLPFTVTFES